MKSALLGGSDRDWPSHSKREDHIFIILLHLILEG